MVTYPLSRLVSYTDLENMLCNAFTNIDQGQLHKLRVKLP